MRRVGGARESYAIISTGRIAGMVHAIARRIDGRTRLGMQGGEPSRDRFLPCTRPRVCKNARVKDKDA